FFAEEDEAAAGAAAEAALARARWINHLAGGGSNGARFIVDVAVAAQVAGIVEHNLFLVLDRLWEPVHVARQKLAMVLDGRRRAVGFPVFLNRAYAMRTDGDYFFNFGLGEGFEIGLGELLEDEIITQAAYGVAGALLFAEHAEAGAEVLHDLRECSDDFAPFGIVAAHAAEP